MALSAHQTDNDGEKAIKTALRGLIMEKKIMFTWHSVFKPFNRYTTHKQHLHTAHTHTHTHSL